MYGVILHIGVSAKKCRFPTDNEVFFDGHMVLFSVDALLVPGNIDTIFYFVFQKNKTIKNFGAIPIVPGRVHPYRLLMLDVAKNRT